MNHESIEERSHAQDARARRAAREFVLSHEIVNAVLESPEFLAADATPETLKKRRRVELALHCLGEARDEVGTALITTEQLLDWNYSLVDELPEDIWCNVADAFYTLALELLRTRPENAGLRRVCSMLHKPLHEFRRALRFTQEQYARDRLSLHEAALLETAGFDRAFIPEHLSR